MTCKVLRGRTLIVGKGGVKQRVHFFLQNFLNVDSAELILPATRTLISVQRSA